MRLARWFNSTLGKTTLALESQAIATSIRRFHGDSMLWLSPYAPDSEVLERCMVRHKFYGVLGGDAVDVADRSDHFHTSTDCLPLRSSSMDAIVMQHALDCADDARAAIREASRVLAPGGRLLLIGFNPMSLWWLRSMYARIRKDAFSGVHFVNPYRATDWLKVLGFEIDQSANFLMFRPPVEFSFMDPMYMASGRWAKLGKHLSRWRIPAGGVYYLLARKASLGQPPQDLIRGHSVLPSRALVKPLSRSGL